jgi:hypothetical protein
MNAATGLKCQLKPIDNKAFCWQIEMNNRNFVIVDSIFTQKNVN